VSSKRQSHFTAKEIYIKGCVGPGNTERGLDDDHVNISKESGSDQMPGHPVLWCCAESSAPLLDSAENHADNT
jgi:hypothetical protein